MIWWLLPAVFSVAWTSIFSTEQLPDYGSQLATRKLFRASSLRKPTVRVFNFEGRLVRNAVVWEGTKVTITCKVHGFPKGTRLSWNEPSGKTIVPTGYGIRIERVFNRVTQSNSGRYICNANDTERGLYVSSSVFLNVEVTPTIRTDNVTALEGNSTVLRCAVTNSTKSYTFSWLREGEKLQSDANTDISRHRKLSFRRVNRLHSGTYECRITLGQVKISAYPQLTVRYPPEISEGPRNVTAEIGDTVTFCCNVTGYPEPTVTWQVNGMAINTSNASATQSKYNQSSEEGIHVITIIDVQQEEDGGRYSCHFENNVGRALESAYLKIQGPPSPPNMKVEAIYGKGVVVFAVLNWTEPDHDGNSPIIAYEPGCKKKNRAKFRATNVDFDVFSAEIPCAVINKPNQTLPSLLHLSLRVIVNNALGSTSSELIDLTVEVRAAKSNQSEVEVFILPSTVSTTTSTKQTPSMFPNISKDTKGQNTTSSLLTSTGPSSEDSTDRWPLSIESEPSVMKKDSSASFHPTVQFLPVSEYNETDYEKESSGDPEKLIYGLGSCLAVLLGAGAIILVYYIFKNRESHLDMVVYPTTCTSESYRVTERTSENLNESSHLDQGSSPAILASTHRPLLVEKTAHRFSTNLVEEEVGPDGGEFYSGSSLLSVPKGALQQKRQIKYQFLFGEPKPTIDIPRDWFVFSPILVLEPHNCPFKVPVSVEFPFTATLEGWTLVLVREETEPGKEWKKVLTLDADTRQVTQEFEDSHCNYDVNKRLLFLDHFCKYFWCGYNAKNSSRPGKRLACLLLARMDSSGKSCNFALHLTDNCFDVFQEVKMYENEKSEGNFYLMDLTRIRIPTDGELKIKLTANGFELEEDSTTIEIRDLWEAHGCLERVLFQGKCVERNDRSQDKELHVKLSTSDRHARLLAIFSKGGESVGLQQARSYSSLADKGERRILSSSRGSLSGDSSVAAEQSPRETAESNVFLDSPVNKFAEASKVSRALPTMISEATVANSNHISRSWHSGDIVTDDVASSVLPLGCEGHDWVKLGKHLLGWSEREVRDLFSNPTNHDMKNSEKVKAVINTWIDRDGSKATIGVLQAAFNNIDKGGAFENLLDKKYQK